MYLNKKLKRNNFADYKDEHKHEQIVSNKHFIEEIEKHNPLSLTYISYWKDIKRKCIEGKWHDGKWMPGNLFFYINLCKIKLKKNEFSKDEITARPFLRDLEWEKGYVFVESRGFSGFKDDDEYTCLTTVETFHEFKNKEEQSQYLSDTSFPPEAYNKKGEIKKFIPARDYLRAIHNKNLGKPLFQNNAANVIDIEARGGGKSYYAAGGMILHNFLMDGANDYDEYLSLLNEGIQMSSGTTVGAIDGKYTKPLLNKVQLAKTNLVGSQTFQGEKYPSPLDKETSGSWYSGAQTVSAYVEKIEGGKWTRSGSESNIYHRSFKDDEHAGNGLRSSLVVIEEVGFFDILKKMLGAMKDTTYNGSDKYGTIYMFGTGGDMDGGSTLGAKEVFTNPREYDCLVFDDIWENTGEVGFFVPYCMTLNQHKDEEGITDIQKSLRSIAKKREPLIKAKSKSALNLEQQNNPNYISEALSVKNANIFPTGELKEHLNWLKSNYTDSFLKGQNGELIWVQNENGDAPKLKWELDLKNRLSPTTYNMKSEDNTEGCIQIWEHPISFEGGVPYGLYIAGTDPYDQDKSVSTASLGSTFIYKTFHTSKGIYEWPVAEYTARPGTANEHHENVRKLLLYYNAKDLYENERNSLKMYFEFKNSLYLLAKTPSILKASENSKVNRQYGTHMTLPIKQELEIYTRDWLTQDAGEGKLNLHKINSIPLLEELINYNEDGNFDRVIAFMLTICHRLMNHHIKVIERKKEEDRIDPFFKRAFTNGFYR